VTQCCHTSLLIYLMWGCNWHIATISYSWKTNECIISL